MNHNTQFIILAYFVFKLTFIYLALDDRINDVSTQLANIASVQQTKVSVIEDTCNVQTVYEYIKECNIKFPDFILAQAIHETGNFTSGLCLENHNLFGMKLAKARPTTAIGERKGYAIYNNWRECILDYAIYQTKVLANKKYKDGKSYIKGISNSYAEDNAYIYKVLQVRKTIEPNIKHYDSLFIRY